MTDLTMGQRIAAQRKLHGLSQEALAEQMAVSRQAISKWESDASIPEVDKLIALGRIFGVSVGWLLGTESECRCDPEAGLNAAQTEMVERIVANARPAGTPLWKRALAALCVLMLLGGMLLHYQSRIDELTTDNVTIQSQLARLAEANQEMQTQLDAMEAMLEKQDSAGKLLSDYGITSMYLSEDMSQVSMTFVLTPKVYLEETAASISVTNPNGYSDSVECAWSGGRYAAHITVPLADDHQFRLILAGAGSWQEELLNEEDSWLSQLKTIASFHIDPEDHAGEQTQPWNVDQRVYTFSAPIQPPYVWPGSAEMSLFDTRLTLYHNGEAIWQERWKEEFRNPYAYLQTHGYLLFPDIAVELPELAAGDELRLEISAELAGGQELTTVLDRRIVE